MHNSPTSPHSLVLFAASGSSSIAAKISEYLDIPLSASETKPFPNGECMVKASQNVRQRDVFIISSICRQWLPTNESPYSGINDALMELLVWGDTLSLASAARVTAVIPNFGYARQDRKTASRTPISARLVCDLLEVAGFDRVLTMDLHADQIQGFFSRRKCKLDHLNATELFSSYLTDDDLRNAVILSPDLGNVKKSDKYRRGLSANIGMAIIDKRRNPHTGEVTVERITGDSVNGKNVILFDDVISTASTMRQAIDIADKEGATSFLVNATHGEFIGPSVEKLRHPKIKEIRISDSIPLLPEISNELPIKVISAGKLFGEAIKRVHKGESISELLGKFG